MFQEYRVGHSWNENMRVVLGPHLRALHLEGRGSALKQFFATQYLFSPPVR